MEIPAKALQNVMILAAHALSGKTYTAEPEQMAELWSDVAAVKAHLAEAQKPGEPEQPA